MKTWLHNLVAGAWTGLRTIGAALRDNGEVMRVEGRKVFG